jgi:hypothetical protein
MGARAADERPIDHRATGIAGVVAVLVALVAIAIVSTRER